MRQPGYGTSYVTGKYLLERLLAERGRQLGDDFTLAGFFHEVDLAGVIPVSLLRWELTGFYAEYRDKIKAAENGQGEMPTRDLRLETLMGVLEGEILVHNHCYRGDEMSIMLEIAEEFGYKVGTFHHAVEAYKIADRLAAANTGASITCCPTTSLWAERDWLRFRVCIKLGHAGDGVNCRHFRRNFGKVSNIFTLRIRHDQGAKVLALTRQ